MVHHYLDTSDAKLTSDLCKHAKVCWGEETVAAADQTRDINATRDALGKSKNGSITEAFEHFAKTNVTCSHRQHTPTGTRWVFILRSRKSPSDVTRSAEIVHWVAESKRPFQIVNDHGFKKLMKTGRPDHHIPSMQTVSHDVKRVFVQVHKRIAKMLQVR
jgi:hypothetical protein